MERDMTARECVAWLLMRDGAVLAEKRKSTKEIMPGALALPGGHLEPGESIEEALRRELWEELAIVPLNPRYVCSLEHQSAEVRLLHYFAITQWEGSIENHEAASLHWVPTAELQALDVDVDRTAISEYLSALPAVNSGSPS